MATTTTTAAAAAAASPSSSPSLAALLQLLRDRPLSTALSRYEYGTAGFRYDASLMDGLMVRVGMLAVVLQIQQIVLREQQQLQAQQRPLSSVSSSSSSLLPLPPPMIEVDMGVMITASHNDESYNGVKLSNPDGSMLTPSQEEFLVKWVNEASPEQWADLVWTESSALLLPSQSEPERPEHHFQEREHHRLHIGRDTRSHSPHLAQLCIDGADAMIGAVMTEAIRVGQRAADSGDIIHTIISVQDHGVLTTPMLHHVVLHSNPSLYLPSYVVPRPTREGYIQTFAEAYFSLCQASAVESASPSASATTNCDSGGTRPTMATATTAVTTPLHVDGACGVGYHAVKEMAQAVQDLCDDATTVAAERATAVTADSAAVADTTTAVSAGNNSPAFTTATVNLVVHNGPGDGPLNDHCGSEHVQKQLSPPVWYDDDARNGGDLDYCCALDGDADRIVFFAQQKKDGGDDSLCLSQLLDGDKIAILMGHVMVQKLQDAYDKAAAKAAVGNNNKVGVVVDLLPKVTLGIVQTAYANGAATDYVKNTLKVPVVTTKTGVKHLHHAAVEHFDIGIYFEANGHGTVVFSRLYEKFALQCRADLDDPFFVQLAQLINPAVGDAISDLLLVDYLLRYGTGGGGSTPGGGWTLEDWNTRLYTDLPSRMLKVTVQDRNVIVCNDNETECIQPANVQPLLAEAMGGYPHGRTFVRPSGTEDVVRVYAEAATRDEADALAVKAAQIVFDTCQGVGTRPS